MKSKIGSALFALLFAIGFGAGGYFGISQLAHHVSGWWQARDWRPVEATVLATELKTSHGEATSYQATARYRYVIDGRDYEGTRVGLLEGFDNIGSWQQDRYRELSAAQQGGRLITVWVDPKNPERAVVDRNLRGSMVAFTIPFATLFPLVSLGAVWMLLQILRAPSRSSSTEVGRGVNLPVITSDAWQQQRVFWFILAFWNLISIPIAIVIIPDLWGRSWMWLFVAIFPTVGVLMIWVALTRVLRLLRNGEVTLTINPAQPRLGEPLGAHAQFSRFAAPGEYVMSLVCERVDTSGENTSTHTVWRQERNLQAQHGPLQFAFAPPARLSPSEPKSEVYHRWRVLLSFPNGKDERAFDVIIDPPRDGAVDTGAAHAFAEITARDVQARPVPEKVATVEEHASRLSIRYNPAKERVGALATMMFALIFGAVGALLLTDATGGVVPKLIGGVLASIGFALLLASVHSLTHRRVIEIGSGRVRVANRWLLRASEEVFEVSDVRGLIPGITGTTTIGTRRYDHHQIKVRLRSGKEVVLGSDIHEGGVARTLLETLQRHLPHAELLKESSRESLRSRFEHAKQQPRNTSADTARKQLWLKRGLQMAVAIFMLAMLWSFFDDAILTGDSEAPVNMALERPRASPPLSPNEQALFDAIVRSERDAVRDALGSGASVQAVNDWGGTPLLIAARSGNEDIVRDLIAAGADINFSVQAHNEYRGRTALMNAATGRGGAIVSILLDAGAEALAFESHGWSALHYAAHRGNVAALQVLASRGVELDLRSPQSRGETPLMIAARFGQLNSIAELIELGADPRAQDRHGENVYGWAKFFNQTAAMEMLREYR